MQMERRDLKVEHPVALLKVFHRQTLIRSWRVLRCDDRRIAVVARVMPIEMWSDDYYEEPQFLSFDEASELLRLVELPQSTKA